LPADAAPSLIYVADLPGVGRRVTLREDESHYLARVCRARVGDRVSATDGRGALASVVLIQAGREAVVEVERSEWSEPGRSAWALSGAPEGERGDSMVEKLAELGVTVFQPLDCERGSWEKMRGRAERWRRVAVAALRQSRRRFLLEVREPLPVAAALAALPSDASRWLADPSGPSAAGLHAPTDGLTVGMIGPSAGLSTDEREAARNAGFSPISFSDSRLRTETAALAWGCWWAAPAVSGHPAS